ncbi:type II toxin-antitoxin system HigB family toxin [Spirosoma pollinicola]|uniref:Addiction module toxin RelE n=1 Tax=Spirosoma pollinicola TaxID=2057025 RepID=A0A2K8YY18_9BACT|nr:type II toxin-antitoxin system HigB family toxin [Spirosoma pollinicola]AUD02438.1 addiction module toxin RelE [Spirosoma pollinicola]
MRIIAKGTSREFWEQNPDAETGLRFWYTKISKNDCNTPNDVINGFNGADTVGNGRIVFNICKNKYCLIIFFRYDIQVAYIRFIGNHKEYDAINDIQTL